MGASVQATALSAPVVALVELRAADSLLRLLRDKLLLSAKILEQEQSDCYERVRRFVSHRRQSGLRARARRVAASPSDAALIRERTRLQMTSALLERQLERLGGVQHLLLSRPTPLSASALVDPNGALKRLRGGSGSGSGEGGGGGGGYGGTATAEGVAKAPSPSPSSSGDGEAAEGTVAVPPVDLEWRDAANDWTRRVRELIKEVTAEVVQSVTRELEAAVAKASGKAVGGKGGGKADDEADDEGDDDADGDGGGKGGGSRAERLARSLAEKESLVKRLEAWREGGGSDGWLAALQLVEGLPQAQRAERRLLPGYTSQVYKRLRRAVPRSMVTVAMGFGVHYALNPRWGEILKAGATARRVALGIWRKRFYYPLRGIVLDLLNRQPRLTTAAALEDSRASLASMLADFLAEQAGQDGVARPVGRAAELQAISTAYESEIKRGAVKTLIRGKLLRLLLIQVQLLKTELLKAMGALDDLVDANRLNMQLLASVPAVVLFGVGWRFFFTLLHMLRTRSGRSMRQVHAQMGRSLEALERCLVLAGSPRAQAAAELMHGQQQGSDHDDDSQTGSRAFTKAEGGGVPEEPTPTAARSGKGTGQGTGKGKGQGKGKGTGTGAGKDKDLDGHPDLDPRRALRGAELGEFVLNLHSYLLLLDFSSPAYPAGEADAIHHEMQDMLRQGELSLGQQAALLRSIKGRHADLAKVLR